MITYPSTITPLSTCSPCVDRLEHRRQPEREHEDADHLHHRQQAVDPVVGVVGRGEPRVLDPCPDDGEHGEAEPDRAGPPVPLGEVVGRLVPRGAEGDDERQVVEQLERCRRRGGARADPVRSSATGRWAMVVGIGDRSWHRPGFSRRVGGHVVATVKTSSPSLVSRSRPSVGVEAPTGSTRAPRHELDHPVGGRRHRP